MFATMAGVMTRLLSGPASFGRLTRWRRTPPCRHATPPKNLGYGEARAGDSVRGTRPIRGRTLMSMSTKMLSRAVTLAAVAGAVALAPARAEDAVKIGLI